MHASRSFFNIFRNSCLRSFTMVSVENTQVISHLEQQARKAEQLITYLKTELQELQNVISHMNAPNVQKLKLENEQLKQEIEVWKNKLIEAEVKNGKKQYLRVSPARTAKVEVKIEQTTPEPKGKEDTPTLEVVKKEKKLTPAKQEKKEPANKAGNVEEPPVDVGRLDFRVGRIVNVKKHPDAESLYVEEVDIGEGKPRTVVSGLVKHVPIELMENRLVVLLCNLKPAKMRGVTSEAMVMCASTPEKVEILIPPKESNPGDLVHFDGFPRNPDPVLNPKKKIFETVAPDLKTSGERVAMYKGVPFTVAGKGVVVAESLVNVNIK